MDSSDALEHARALEFFGFEANEKPDLILLRSRKFNKQRSARTAEQKALVERYFQVLSGSPSQSAPTPSVPAMEARAVSVPPATQPNEREEEKSDKTETHADRQNRRQQLDGLLPRITGPIDRLHNDHVINNTYGLMTGLRQALQQACQLMLDGDVSWMTAEQRDTLVETLLSLYSSLIMGALHKGELPITNAIIQHKNSILRTLKVDIPDSHNPINPKDYKYNW